MIQIILFFSTLLISGLSQSAILIENINDDGKKGRVLIEEGRARIDAGALGGYLIINLDDGGVFAVNHRDKVVLDLSSTLKGISEKKQKKPVVRYKNKGPGPVIAGYKTTRYSVSINGMHCFDEYLSMQLIANPHVKRFTEIIGEFTGVNAITGLGVPFDADAPCESAGELFDDYYQKLGLPMRTVESNGLLSHEITRINTKLDPPAGTFATPPGYKKISREESNQRALKNTPGHGDMSKLTQQNMQEMAEKIKKQLAIIKKRRAGIATTEESDAINTAPISK